MIDLIHWDKNRAKGYAVLEDVRRIYQRGAVKPADGMPPVMEPEIYHVHKFSTEIEPVIITNINYKKGLVWFIPLPQALAFAVHQGRTHNHEKGGIIVNAR